MTTSTAPTIGQQRLVAQRIAGSLCQSPVEAVRWLGAVQAQDYASAEWTIGLRLPAGSTRTAVEQAIMDKSIVRTWLLRGTLHIVPAADVHWMLATLGPAQLERDASFHRKLGLDDDIVARCGAIVEGTLRGGQPLTRKELAAALAAAGLEFEGMVFSVLLNRLALQGLICLGPMAGKQPTYVLLDEWLPKGKMLSRDEALAELALRYFTSHGPATLQDFAWWMAVSMADAKIGLEAAKSQLIEDVRENKSYWRAATTPTPSLDEPSVYLLPGFDEYILGYANRSDVVQKAHEKLISGNNAVFAYTMVLDGRVVGMWKRTVRKGAVEITLLPFAPLPPEVMPEFEVAAHRYGEFHALLVVLHPM